MTLYEYQLYSLAYEIKSVGKAHETASQAWQNSAVKATKGTAKNPRPVYRQYDDFFNYEQTFERVMTGDKTQDNRNRVASMNRYLNKKREEVNDNDTSELRDDSPTES